MTQVLEQITTPLRIAEAALADADAQVRRVEKENAAVEEKFGAAREQFEDALQARGADSKDAVRARAAMAGLTPQLLAGRDERERALRVRTNAANRVSSEQQAVRLAELAVAAQTQRLATQAEALRVAREEVRRKEIATDVETQRLTQLEAELRALSGDDPETRGDL